MQDYYHKLIEELNKQNPGALPENAATSMPDSVGQELSSRIPAIDPENYGVHVSDNTVTMDGNVDTTPVSTDDIKLPEPDVVPSAPVDTTPALPSVPITEAKTKIPAKKSTDLSAITTPDEVPVRGKRNPLPILAAGIGDAISASSSAFGGNAPGGSMQREVELQDKDLDRAKTEAELKIQNDPNSSVSKNYRQMVAQIVPDLAKNPDFQNMSAKMIGDKVPMIDTMMKAQAQKDIKELGMQQIKAQKEANTLAHNDQLQGKYEKEGRDVILKQLSNRSGGLGLQDSKVNQAIDLRQMINQNYNPKTDTYNIPPALHSELVLGLARLISPNGQIGIQLEQELKTKTAKEGLAKTFTYLTGVPVSGAPQDVIKMFVQSIDRQGETAEALRDKYNTQLRQLMPTQLNDDVKQKLMQQEMGSKFSDYKNPKKASSTKESSIVKPKLEKDSLGLF